MTTLANGERVAGDGHRPRRGAWRRYGAPALVVAIVALAGFLVVRTLGQYRFDDVVASVSAVPLYSLLMAGVFAAASYLCLTGFDYLAVRYAGKPLAYRRTAVASFTALSLGHNIGFAALSSGTIRYRYYARWGLDAEEVAKVILFCALTVGLGLTVLAGLAMTIRPDLAVEVTGLAQPVVLALGILCLAVPAAYVLLAAVLRGELRIARWSLRLPPLRLALGQLVIGPLNFALVAACLHQAIAGVADIAYFSVASVYVLANVATIVSHVPGGLGVIEAVVLLLLPQADLLGAVLVFRFVYFFVPLALGGLTLGISELVFRLKPVRRSAGA